jgi:deoxyribonuclease-1-like protein
MIVLQRGYHCCAVFDATFTMKFLLVFVGTVFLIGQSIFAQLKVCSWNLQNFGDSKDEAQIQFIAATLRDFDIVAIQEVLIGAGGPKAVARLCDALNRTGSQWQYIISEPTSSYFNYQQRERYAYIWKSSVVRLIGKAYLDRQLERIIEREPFRAVFDYKNHPIELVNFHALPKKKNPEKEIRYLHLLDTPVKIYARIILGDFNCVHTHEAFAILKAKGYEVALHNQRTTMKQDCRNDECLASAYDNMLYTSGQLRVGKKGAIPFYKSFNRDMKRARKLSDHLPIYAEFYLN